MRILVVEDDAMIADGIRAGLTLAGASIDCVANCEDAAAALAANTFSAVVLDVMLPDGSGLDLLRRLRAGGDATPVLLLTALDEVGDRIAGLDSGADDHLGKPFDLDELGARLRAIIRRRDGRAATCLEHGAIRLFPAESNATLDGAPVPLSRREFAVLHALMERPGVIRSRGELEERLYGWGDEVDSNAVEVHIHNLRAKLGRAAIETVRGVGYRIKPR
ncbi:two component transcriptional regulator, winged helix family [Rhodopseudomonas palustris HaA2]|uniref:Two component transcriptional regulator, winged helix family n=1 Tax=Rhodopseudomonas palustris (strain HaA2) TaxID=316058 RepID=Q2IRW4_RHOP2|nr:response regulator transcription factor [Rhodopseudomonas palustris]ABD09046.1 two component transcriptional regulator, winged helix family [Rhodopseudomonas palustris HaA2]